MVEITGVRFNSAGKVYYFDPKGQKLKVGTSVLVETARGIEMGHIVIGNKNIDDSEVVAPLKPILRVATEEDFAQVKANKEKEKDAFIIGAGNLKPIELGTIYDLIFSKYCPNYNITINNLYIHDAYNTKEHFILMNYDEKYYSYNYNRNSFVEISKEEIIKNIETKKIGIYRNEKIPFITNEIEKVI